jgi:hypothetical protein
LRAFLRKLIILDKSSAARFLLTSQVAKKNGAQAEFAGQRGKRVQTKKEADSLFSSQLRAG